MTISYSDTFVKLLVRWEGSLWKSVWHRLLIYLTLYYILNFIYRFFLDKSQQRIFLLIVDFCDESMAYIPLEFLLGFFVSSILARWWSQCNYISYPDSVMLLVTTYIQGEKYLVLRRTIARWLNLSAVLGWRTVCSRTLTRFPREEHVVLSGLMTEAEFETYKLTGGPHGKWFLPLLWINNLLEKCRRHKIIDSVQLKSMVKEVYKYRMGMIMLKIFEWISIPLAYTQVVTIATYGYFFITLFSRQITGRTDKPEPDLYVPIFTILQFLFYMGWFTVGEDLINPLGDDDDDFELNYVLDRNFQTSFLLAEQVNGQLPPLEKDLYWGQKNPMVPHTRASLRHRDKIFNGHLANFKIDENDQQVVDQADEGTAEKESAQVTKKFSNLIRQVRKITSPAMGRSKVTFAPTTIPETAVALQDEPTTSSSPQDEPEDESMTSSSIDRHPEQRKIHRKPTPWIRASKVRDSTESSQPESMRFTYTEDDDEDTT